MLWFYGRGSEALTIETRYDEDAGVYELIWHRSDNTPIVEQFASEADFHERAREIESTLAAERWIRSHDPVILPGGWRKTPAS
jgi:hypothetical protein